MYFCDHLYLQITAQQWTCHVSNWMNSDTCGITASAPDAVRAFVLARAFEQFVFFLDYCSWPEESQWHRRWLTAMSNGWKRPIGLAATIQQAQPMPAMDARGLRWAQRLCTTLHWAQSSCTTLMQETLRTQIQEDAEGMQEKRGIRKGLVNCKGLLQRPSRPNPFLFVICGDFIFKSFPSQHSLLKPVPSTPLPAKKCFKTFLPIPMNQLSIQGL